LDFALLRLDGDVASSIAFETKRPRGFFSLPSGLAPERGKTPTILQYPLGLPLARTLGGWISEVSDDVFHYTGNTLVGSSGAPCFDLQWNLIGMHVGSDGLRNHGIPIRRIRDVLMRYGVLPSP
jgi:hypothetical protein